jgi:FtsP/CotA-like multicopper oxidase with cupredoxin domain
MKSKYLLFVVILLGAFLWLTPIASGQAKRKPLPAPNANCAAGQMNCVTNADRKAAAARSAAVRKGRQPIAAPLAAHSLMKLGANATSIPLQPGCPPPAMNPGGMPDYMSGCVANYATSPLPITDSVTGAYVSGGLRKFVDILPGIPVGHADSITYPGSDYYEIALVQFEQQMHSDLPHKTLLRGYVQLNNGTDANGHNTITPSAVQYLGPIIVAQKNRPVRIKFTNRLPLTGTRDGLGQDGNLFLPVDTSVMGSGMGPSGSMYAQNRSGIHLHGGNTPWISDGTPHQWTTPAGENTSYPKGVSVQNVPDMPSAGPGEMTFFYTNQQSARLMFYHDHAYGITRLNVYAGVAAGYLIQDPVEQTLVNGGVITPPSGAPIAVPAGTIPADQVALVIQDKTFVPATDQLAAQDPTWNWGRKDTNGNFYEGDLWFPHVYMPNQNPSDLSGANAMGRWDWGPWFWPPMDPSTLMQGEVACPTPFNADQSCPGTPNPSLTPEAFMDTPLVNGVAYPYAEVQPKAYRVRILNASNDRSLSLSLYQAFDKTGLLPADGTGVFVPDPAAATPVCTTPSSTAPAAGTPQTCTEVRFVNAPDGIVSQGPMPDPATKGPQMIQIGTEGGFLPAPVVLDNTPIGFNYNRRDIVVLNVIRHNLLLGPAERADIIIDFSQYAGKTLILYNDSPAPMPAFDTRYDYYTGDADQTEMGGAPSTLPGFGPNTRTVMQIRVLGSSNGAAFDPAPLTAALPAAFAASEHTPIVPESVYNQAYGTTNPNIYSRIQDTGIVIGVTVANGGTGYGATPAVTITGGGGKGARATATVSGGVISAINLTSAGSGYTSQPSIAITDGTGTGASATVNFYPVLRKTIQELFELDYGRMNATLGVELPLTNFNTQTTIPLGYMDPPTETFKEGETQIWKITHNGVDTHAIHFHLFDVQLINRVGWDGAIRPPEADEVGWKETVRMSPLEDAIVAVRPNHQNLPFPVPQNIRLLDVTSNQGNTLRIFNPSDGNQLTGNAAMNDYVNFGAEYVWHCHLLGHEENDMMRPMIYNIPPEPPQSLTAIQASGISSTLSWVDASATETGFEVQRDIDPAFSNPLSLGPAAASTTLNRVGQGTDFGSTIQLTDPAADCVVATCYYRVRAVNNQAFNGYDANGVLNAPQTLYGFWSNVASLHMIVAPNASLSPASLIFANRLVGTTSATQPLVLTNNGTGVLNISSIVLSGANAADFTKSTCPASLGIGASCTINVAFKPSARGVLSASIVFTDNAASSPQTVNISGTGIAPAASVFPVSLAFGAQLNSIPSTAQTLVISNNGDLNLAVNSFNFSGTNASQFLFSQGTCGVPVAPASSCTMSVTFKPTSSGAKTATLNIANSDPLHPILSIPVTGTGTAIQLVPTSIAFGNVSIGVTSTGATVTLKNYGPGTITINNIALSGVDASQFSRTTTCGGSLASGASCTATVRFAPLLGGPKNAALTFTTSDAGQPTASVTLTGTGVLGVLTTNPTALTFGSAYNTASAPQTITLTNSGSASLRISGFSLGGTNLNMFTQTNTCSFGTPIAPGGGCTVSVTFRPTVTSPTTLSQTLNIVYYTAGTQTMSIPLTGTLLQPGYSVLPTTLSFGNLAINTISAAQTVTVTNTGQVPLSITNILLGGLRATQFSQTNTCGANPLVPFPSSLAVGASCTISATFQPTSRIASTATITVFVGATPASTTINLSGTGQ